MQTKRRKKVVLLIIYVVFLFWTMVLKGQFHLEKLYIFPSARITPVNFSGPLSSGSPIMDSIVNILFCFPFGYMIGWLKAFSKRLYEILFIAVICFLVEILKFRLMTDAFVAVNFIINTIGGILGLLAYKRYDPDKDTDVTYTKRAA